MDDVARNAQQIASVLARLSKARTLTEFAMTTADIRLCHAVEGQVTFLAPHNQELLQAWLTTLAHGFRLFLAEPQQSDFLAHMMTLAPLTRHIRLCLASAASNMPQQLRIQISVLLVRTGGQHVVLQ